MATGLGVETALGKSDGFRSSAQSTSRARLCSRALFRFRSAGFCFLARPPPPSLPPWYVIVCSSPSRLCPCLLKTNKFCSDHALSGQSKRGVPRLGFLSSVPCFYMDLSFFCAISFILFGIHVAVFCSWYDCYEESWF